MDIHGNSCSVDVIPPLSPVISPYEQDTSAKKIRNILASPKGWLNTTRDVDTIISNGVSRMICRNSNDCRQTCVLLNPTLLVVI
jgi:transposase